MCRNIGGKFIKLDLGTLPAVAGRGAAFGDLRNDGNVNVIMTVLGGRPIVFANRGVLNHWVTLKLIGVQSNRDGAGARVKVGSEWAYATTSGSYLSASDGRVHFGLGREREATVEIIWPSGRKQNLTHVPADQILTLREPE